MSALCARACARRTGLIGALLWLAPLTAAAHAFPTPFRVLFHPTDPARLAVTLRPGLALTENGGADWNFVCGAASGIAGSADYAAAFDAEGRLLIGAFTALYRDDGLGCSWSRLDPGSGLPQGRVAALELHEGGTLEALSAAPGSSNGLFVSDDGGIRWRARGSPLEDVMPTSFARAPSRPEQVYATAVVNGGSASVLFASTDGGEHWRAMPLAGELSARVLAIDPLDPQRVYVLRSQREAVDLPDHIEVSGDAGVGFSQVIALPAIGGFALTADGSALFVGSREGGLYRIERDGAPELRDPGVHVGCLQLRGGTLWVCGDDQLGDPFAVATSTDGGATLTPLLRSEQVTRLRTCGNPHTAQLCSAEWNQWKNDVFGSTLDPPLGGPDAQAAGETASARTAAGSGGAAPVSSPRSSTGDPRSTMAACRAGRPGGEDSPSWLWALFGLAGAGLCSRMRSSPVTITMPHWSYLHDPTPAATRASSGAAQLRPLPRHVRAIRRG